MSEGTTRGEAAAHILAREMGRRTRAVHARIDDVEAARREALEELRARLNATDGIDARQDGLIGGLRAEVGNVQEIATALDQAHGQTRELTAVQAAELARIAQRLNANETTDARQDNEIADITDRVDVLEATAPVSGPKGDKGDRGPSGPRGAMGPPGVPGAVGSGTGSGGGGNINSVSVSSGLSITGVSDLTITNTGVRSLAASGISVSSATGEVTITAPTVSGGTGITVAGSGTTTLTVSATGVNSVSGGTGISVSGTTSLTVTNTGVTNLAGTGVTVSASTGAVTITAPVVAGGTGISVSGSQTTSLTVTNTGVTALAGTGISVSAATGSVTVTPTYAAPTALTIGGTAVTGAASSVANSAHVHAMPGSAVAGASAVGDTAATGSATTVALSDHRHSREAFGTPVVVNGQTTALATGSLTTLARADHVHTMSNAWVRIASVTTASSATSITFSSIPQTYNFLRLMLHARSQSVYSLTAGVLRFNGDTGSNYYSADLGTASQTYIRGALFSGPATYDANIASVSEVCIAGYSSTLFTKPCNIQWGAQNNTSATASFAYASFYGIWRSTAAITSITMTMDSAEAFANGTTAVLMAC